MRERNIAEDCIRYKCILGTVECNNHAQCIECCSSTASECVSGKCVKSGFPVVVATGNHNTTGENFLSLFL